jgi:O-antigen/teichoic acid export membrane protein
VEESVAIVSLKKNVVANYIGLGTAALAPVLALPWYLTALGPKLFGLVAFVSTLQAVLALLDAGLSQALVREFSVRMATHQIGHRSAGTLLFGFERLYWLFGLCAGVLTAVSAGLIAEHWLQLNGLTVFTGRKAVYGAAAIFALQFPGSVYRSFLIGAQVQVPLNVITVVFALLRHGGGVAIVLAYPALGTYLLWQAGIALLESLVRARVSWRTIGLQRRTFSWKPTELKRVGTWCAGMSAATLLGALTVQMDKIILIRMITVEQFGYYVIASTVATGTLQLVYPVMQAVLPRAIRLREDCRALHDLYVKIAKIVAVISIVGATIYLLAGKQLIGFWLRSASAANAVYPLLTILLVGTALNAFYNVGYLNWIVQEKAKRILLVNSLSLVLSIILIPLLVGYLGAGGAAVGWLTINLVGFLISLEWIKQSKSGFNNLVKFFVKGD